VTQGDFINSLSIRQCREAPLLGRGRYGYEVVEQDGVES